LADSQPKRKPRIPEVRETDVDVVIAGLVHRGVVTHSELREAGVGEGAIRHRLKQKRLHRVWTGIYFVGHPDPAEFGREYAALMVGGEDAALSRKTAAVLWGLLPRQVDTTIHLALSAQKRNREGLLFHEVDLHPTEVRTIHNDLRITTPARTLLDLAAELSADLLERAVADALRRPLTTEKELHTVLARHPRARGRRKLVAILQLEGGPQWDRSKAERELIKLVRKAGLPVPESNHRMGSSSPDLVWREQRVLVEIDGFGFHGDRIAFERDRARDASRTAEGWRTLRFTWRQIRDRPHETIARLAATLAIAG